MFVKKSLTSGSILQDTRITVACLFQYLFLFPTGSSYFLWFSNDFFCYQLCYHMALQSHWSYTFRFFFPPSMSVSGLITSILRSVLLERSTKYCNIYPSLPLICILILSKLQTQIIFQSTLMYTVIPTLISFLLNLTALVQEMIDSFISIRTNSTFAIWLSFKNIFLYQIYPIGCTRAAIISVSITYYSRFSLVSVDFNYVLCAVFLALLPTFRTRFLSNLERGHSILVWERPCIYWLNGILSF